MLGSIFAPYVFLGPLILRVALAAVLINHGLPKFSDGLKGFAGWLGSLGFPIPMFWAAVVAILEVFGGAALILGFAVRWVALLVAIEFLVILIFVKKGRLLGPNELDLLIFAIALFLLLWGSGPLGIDAYWPTFFSY